MTGRMPSVRAVAMVAAMSAVVFVVGCTDGEASGAVSLHDARSALTSITATGVVAEPGAAGVETTRVVDGFVAASDGLVVTSADVVGAADVAVVVGDGSAVPATILGSSECLDMAVLRVDGGDGLPFLAWRRGAVRAGTAVHAGVPAGASAAASVPDGTVSSVETPIVDASVAAAEGMRHDVVLPTGSAGAPLLDDEGRVAAVAHADADAAGSAAVSAWVVRAAVEAIVAGDDVGSFGISGRAWADAENVVSGVWVRAVAPDGPAGAVGVQPGDVITTLGGRDVGLDGTVSAYCAALSEADGAPVDVEIYRPSTDQVLAGETSGEPLQVVSTGEVRRSGAFATVTDASGLVRVDVPAEWTAVDGAGFTDAAGATWYSLVAAPSVARFRSDRTSPGVQIAATTAGASVNALLEVLSSPYRAVCSPLESSQPYADGRYRGEFSRFLCDRTVVMVLSVLDARGVKVAVVTQLTSPVDQQQTLSRILSTFDVGAR